MRDSVIDILLVENDPDDVRMVLDVFLKGSHRRRVEVLGGGEEAMAYLRRERDYEGAARPQLVLMSLELSGKTGFEVLEEIKGDESLGGIPVVIFTKSLATADIRKAYQLQANAYVHKPEEPEERMLALKSIELFWLETVSLPL